MTHVRTRYAPSPTGYLHVGGVRTVLFSWALARRFKGEFLLRIEDTDQERLVPGAIRSIIEDFQWLGLNIDEGPSHADLKAVGEYWEGAPDIGGPKGPYIQSLRLPRYREVAEQLISKGLAYRCDCTSETLERERNEQMARREPPGYSGYCRHRGVSADSKHVIRLIVPERRALTLEDLVRGRIHWETPALKDSVILKSDGFPTYHLAVVVDDHDMQISHALRGEEWISTTPLHLLMYEGLGWEPPRIGHLPQVLGADGKKLSKRHGATQLNVFRESGYLPEALLNFLLLIGWSEGDGTEQEVYSIEQMIEKFDTNGISKSGGVFAYDKLDWMNGIYIRNLRVEDLKAKIMPYLKAAGLEISDARLSSIVPHIQERLKKLNEAPDMVDFLTDKPLKRDLAQMYKKGIDQGIAKRILELSYERLSALSDFSSTNIERELKQIVEGELQLKLGPAFGVIRIAVTGKAVTPPLFESLHALGQGDTLRRIKETIGMLR